MRTVIAVFLLVHGIAHMVGFAVPWRLVHSPDLPYRTTIAGGMINLGDSGIRAYGVLWLVMAIAFVVVAAQVVLRAPSWPVSLTIVALASAALCALSLPEARFGLGVNVAVLALVVVGAQRGWLPALG